jgi:RNA polymerase sigma factor (TIGR02999 family)
MSARDHSQTSGELFRLVRAGDVRAREKLFRLLYDDLRRLAAFYMRGEHASHTLQPTALVNEVYLRLFGDKSVEVADRGHFLALAGRAMRRLLVDHARSKGAAKRSLAQRVSLPIARQQLPVQVLSIDQALNRLELIDERQCRIVEMRFFAGLSEEEIAEALGISARTVKRDWKIAKAWLFGKLSV